MHTTMIEETLLGKRTEYPRQYAPEILVGVPRYINRETYSLKDDNLPFVGIDTWHGYEIGFLTENGLPAVGILKLPYPASTPCIVESKSLKLYLNSLNMEHFGCNAIEGYELVAERIRQDVSKCVGGEVSACVFGPESRCVPSALVDYSILENEPWASDIVIDRYTEAPELLEKAKDGGIMTVATHLLRSNCKITHQPDWGTAYILMSGKDLPTEESLLKYLVSIRGENHFHEEICEMIYTRLWRAFRPDEMMVCCVYTRRGGIDICPMRASSEELLPVGLKESALLTEKLMRQ